MPWVPEVTSDVGYVRFHGRNAQAWFGTSTAERYNYCYSEAELQELAGRVQAIRNQVDSLFVFFNNCHAGHAVQNARRMAELLDLVRRKGLPAVPLATRPLADVNMVLNELRAGKVVGRVVLTPPIAAG